MFLKSSLFVFVTLQFLLETLTVLVPNPCQRPTGEPGHCKPLKQCSSLSANIQGSSRRTRNYIWHSHCGFDGEHPKVCCPLSSKETIPSKNATLISTSLLPGKDICGLPRLTARLVIVGGVNTQIDEFPWMAALEYTNYNTFGRKYLSLNCGGSLISNRYVLTAAHCINENLVSVRLGEWNTETDPDCDERERCAPSFLRISIQKSHVFESYNPLQETKYHDIALLRLAEEVTFSDYVKPICLPTTVDDLFKSYVGEMATVAGWGLTQDDIYSHIMLKVAVPVQNLTACSRSVDEGQLCAGGDEGKGSCRGDSGGSLVTSVINEHYMEQWYLIGVVSGGPYLCAQIDKPAYYARVSKYLAWIVDNLKP